MTRTFWGTKESKPAHPYHQPETNLIAVFEIPVQKALVRLQTLTEPVRNPKARVYQALRQWFFASNPKSNTGVVMESCGCSNFDKRLYICALKQDGVYSVYACAASALRLGHSLGLLAAISEMLRLNMPSSGSKFTERSSVSPVPESAARGATG